MSENKGVTVRDVAAKDFVVGYAKYLKRSGKIEVPKWADIVKTAAFKELAPYDPDWFYIRTASIARKVYLRQGTGIGAFRKVYGGRKNNGTAPSHFALSSGSVARHALKQLEAIKVVEKYAKGGRQVSAGGRRDLDRIAGQILNKRKKAKEPRKEGAKPRKTTTQRK